MMRKRLTYCIGFLWCTINVVVAQQGHKQLRKGDEAYRQQQYEKAAEHYRKAEEEQADFRSSYNLGNALMQQNKHAEADEKYGRAAERAADADARAAIQHNKGNALFSQGKFQESVEAYKKALQFKPSDPATLENLMLAKKRLRQQQAQNQQNQQSKRDTTSNKDKKEGQNNKDGDNRNNPSNPSQQSQNPSGNSKMNHQGAPSDSNGLKESGAGIKNTDANQLLDIMSEEEKRVQRKMSAKGPSRAKGKKDW